jgi:hypothetical protein
MEQWNGEEEDERDELEERAKLRRRGYDLSLQERYELVPSPFSLSCTDVNWNQLEYGADLREVNLILNGNPTSKQLSLIFKLTQRWCAFWSVRHWSRHYRLRYWVSLELGDIQAQEIDAKISAEIERRKIAAAGAVQ